MARVFLATETSLGRRVVIKLLSPDLAAEVSAERFTREIRLAASLQQANIVPLLQAGEFGGLPYYTMPYVEGESLRARLRSGVPLAIADIVRILGDVARALAYAHQRGVVHRDIKPDNVLLSGGTAVVTDFGIAKALEGARLPGRRSGEGATLTQIGTSLGTPAYMAPEQAAADPNVDHRADIYAFGCMAFELLTGQPPFQAGSTQRVIAAQISERPQPVSDLRPDTPPIVADLVMRCLAKEPAARPESAAELVRVLDAVPSGSGTGVARPLLAGRATLPRALVVYMIAFAFVALIAKAAIVAVGLPDWVFPGALVVMSLGLPMVLFTGYVYHAIHPKRAPTPLRPGGSAPRRSGRFASVAVRASPHVSWARTVRWGAYALGTFALLVAVAMALRTLGIGPTGTLLAAGRLNAKQPLLVADFRGIGPDSSLAYMVSDAVRTELGQSRVVTVVAPSTVAAALERMRRPRTARVDLPLAREIAARQGVGAIVDGQVTPVGITGGYAITVRLVSADSGTELAAFRAVAASPAELLGAIDDISRQLRAKIGESLKSVRANPPLAQATTPSLEALRAFTEGARAAEVNYDVDRALLFLRRAVSIDTEFAAAYRKLAVVLDNSGQGGQEARDAADKAYRFRGRLPPLDADHVAATYFISGSGRDRAKALPIYQMLADSGDEMAQVNLADLHMRRREFAVAESLSRVTVARRRLPVPMFNLIDTQIDQGKLDLADSTLAAARAAYPDSPWFDLRLFQLRYLRGKFDDAAHPLARMRANTSAGVRLAAMRNQAGLALVRGHVREFMALLDQGIRLDSALSGEQAAIDSALFIAPAEVAVLGEPARAVRRLDETLARAPLRGLPAQERPYLRVAWLYAVAGRPDRALRVLAERGADVRDTAVLRDEQPALHTTLGEIALSQKRPRVAIDEFTLGDRRPDGPADDCTICLSGELARGYDAAGMPDSAIVMFERYLVTPYHDRARADLDPMLLAATYQRLGELYEGKHDPEKAAGYYQRFIDLWKTADPELQPRVAEIRARAARLRGNEPAR